MLAAYTWEHDDGNDYEIKIEFKILPGDRMTYDHPGSPAEVDWHGFTCPANPEKAIQFETLARDDWHLSKQVDEACFDAAEGYEGQGYADC